MPTRTTTTQLTLTEYAVLFSAVALPLTYIPIFLVANDRTYMREFTNGRVANVLGLFYLVVIMVVALSAALVAPTATPVGVPR